MAYYNKAIPRLHTTSAFSNITHDSPYDFNNNTAWSDYALDKEWEEGPPLGLLPAETLEEQQYILMSDPNYIRQQHLLQEKQTLQQHGVDYYHGSLSEDAAPTTPVPIAATPIAITLATPSINTAATLSTSTPRPIPVAGEGPIDHQRRFNELQARFRVNYAQSSLSSSERGRSFSPPLKDTTTAPHLASSLPSRTMPIQIQRVYRQNPSQPLDAEQHQRRLDDQLIKVNFDDITVSELKEMLRQRSKPATGKKAVLMQRLQEERELIKVARHGKPLSSSQLLSVPMSMPMSMPMSVSMSVAGPEPRLGSVPVPVPVPIHCDTLYSHSFQGTPLSSPCSPAFEGPSSVPNSYFAVGSPAGTTHSLNSSIANMHIGSPPHNVRRYSPYGSGMSRIGSPKPPQSPGYGSLDESSHASRGRNLYPWNPAMGSNGRNKTYAPFTSSTLATPDREVDINPFDMNRLSEDYAEDHSRGIHIKQEMGDWTHTSRMGLQGDLFLEDCFFIDPLCTLDTQQDSVNLLESFSQQELMALLNTQPFQLNLPLDPFMASSEQDSHFNSATHHYDHERREGR
ncbi:hypothetical protein BDF14DRAFT_1881676 [Spinellus fusiger]|nr:hypothetical protein BDF14DRAFT_1881676 [Spinellus fusiger]